MNKLLILALFVLAAFAIRTEDVHEQARKPAQPTKPAQQQNKPTQPHSSQQKPATRQPSGRTGY